MKASLLALPLAALALAGCGTLGGEKATPDEFAVVSKAPLVLPPEYRLTPPRPGEQRPQELQPNEQARSALLGAQAVADATDGEQALVARAGGFTADPAVRIALDREVAGVTYKPRSFADRILFWDSSTRSIDGTELDPEREAERLDNINDATGGGDVTIVRNRRVAPKIPGL